MLTFVVVLGFGIQVTDTDLGIRWYRVLRSFSQMIRLNMTLRLRK